jgi:hypothetical protein
MNRSNSQQSDPACERLLSAKDIGEEFGVSADTVLGWWRCGLPTGYKIPREYHRRRGLHGHLFCAPILDFIRREQAKLD